MSARMRSTTSGGLGGDDAAGRAVGAEGRAARGGVCELVSDVLCGGEGIFRRRAGPGRRRVR